MNALVPGYLAPYVLAGNVAIVAALLTGLNRALQRAKWPDRDRRHAVGRIATLLLAGWVAALGLSWLGAYQGLPLRTPTIQYGIGAPIVAGVILYRRWGTLRRVLETVPQEWITGVQLYRVLGLIFLVLYAQGRLPGPFAWPAGAGDVFIGLLAPVVAFAHGRRWNNAASLLRAWNWCGIADLIVAVATGVLTSPSPLQMLALDSPNHLISAFPLAMVPAFLVPISVLLHLASLKKLDRVEQSRSTTHPVLARERS